MTVPNAVEVIRSLAQQSGDRILIGAGTVLDPGDCAHMHPRGRDVLCEPESIAQPEDNRALPPLQRCGDSRGALSCRQPK